MLSSPSDADELLALDNQFCFALYSASLAMTKTYKPYLDKLGLTYPQYLVMLVLWKKDDVLVKTIGEMLHLDSGTLTPLLKRLEALSMLTRTRDDIDERQVRIALTREGKLLKRKAKDIPQQILCASGQTQSTLITMRTQLMEVRDELVRHNG